MIKHFILLACIAQIGCGEDLCQDSDLKYGGLCIQKGFDISKSDIGAVINSIERETAVYYPSVINIEKMFKKKEIRVEFVDGNLAMKCKKYEKDVYECEDYILGVNYDGHHIYAEYEECLAQSALAHELLHSIEKFYLGKKGDNDRSNDHDTPWLFTKYLDTIGAEKFYDIVEVRIAIDLACTLPKCMEDFSDSFICTEVWPTLHNINTEPSVRNKFIDYDKYAPYYKIDKEATHE